MANCGGVLERQNIFCGLHLLKIRLHEPAGCNNGKHCWNTLKDAARVSEASGEAGLTRLKGLWDHCRMGVINGIAAILYKVYCCYGRSILTGRSARFRVSIAFPVSVRGRSGEKAANEMRIK
jgi:hypothetical protein